MRIFIATFGTETNTFSPLMTGRAAFMGERDWYRSGATTHPTTMANLPLKTWRDLAEADGHEIVESICSFAQPAGPTLRGVYEELRGYIMDDLKAAGPVDMVLLSMHGAMVAVGYDDCEGDVLAHARAITGPDTVIGTVLDLHCHLTPLMMQNANLIITYKEYPHDDIKPRSVELYRLASETAQGTIRPVMAEHDCRMLSIWRTPHQPVRAFVDRMQALEGHDGILSVSFIHGFPWADVPHVGAKLLVIADGDANKAQALADRLGKEVWEMREANSSHYLTPDEGIDAILASTDTRPLVLADVSDNAGGGAASDNTVILRRLIDRNIRDVVIGCFWDPQVVAFCQDAGVGEKLTLRLGGKCGPTSGDPVDLTGTVRAVTDNLLQIGLGGGRSSLGPAVWLDVNGIAIVVVSGRQQTFSPEAFTNLGIELSAMRGVIVKSAQHFYNRFADLASNVLFVSAPGCVQPDMETLKLPRSGRLLWPQDGRL
ncbi:M81 family metallopeptidase [Acetobacter senegalensis]|uniref:M81 family metallopeptidase n=1 Tax=Acetobacter senegalensis TaxID=446692 RepID=UPI00128E71FF|nr:M81 family metallopeptidase [Acetobacter senegalensis]MCG4256368.1 M81 family metallopeptidase [Acetobacter senegalensis]MCG4266074.1 M81 family metallopeptidase [Acetobacter senegalensis]MPQ73060.1 microcystin LR degradation protein MlrC-like protein [Acetobacter senegalensis]